MYEKTSSIPMLHTAQSQNDVTTRVSYVAADGRVHQERVTVYLANLLVEAGLATDINGNRVSETGSDEGRVGATQEFEVRIEGPGNVVVTVEAHSPRAMQIGVKQADADALAEILERLHRDYVVRGGHR